MRNRAGFTIVELIVVFGIMAIVISYVTVNLTSIQHRTYLATTIDTFLSDLKQQQLKAMVGDTEGRGTTDSYGVYFEQNRYTIFHGIIYSSTDPANFEVDLEDNLEFSAVAFPQSQIVFSKGSGEVTGYTAGSDTVTLRNTVTSEQQTVTVNRYGVVTSIN